MIKYRVVANDDSTSGGFVFGNFFLFYIVAKDKIAALQKAYTRSERLKLGWCKRDLIIRKARMQ